MLKWEALSSCEYLESIPLACSCLERDCAIKVYIACNISFNINGLSAYCCRFLVCFNTIFVVVSLLTCHTKINVTV